MCGIIGYIGPQRASEIIVEGLKKLEYRGYDSVGIAALGERIEIKKDKGKVEEVSKNLDFVSLNGGVAIGHSRWATHGVPCKENAHPHEDCGGEVVIVHNGVIENYRQLKEKLAKAGHRFKSDTDTEVIAHLIEGYLKTNEPLEAFKKSISELEGSYAIAAIISQAKDRLFIARKGSPLIIGIGKGEMFCASDIPAMLRHTKTFVPMEDYDYGFIARHGYELFNIKTGSKANRKPITVDWNIEMAEKGGYPHFMLKEINDQKHFVHDSLASDVENAKKIVDEYGDIDIVACGTSYHAALLLSLLLDKNGKRCKAYIASDYPFVGVPNNKTLVIAITQSGETADVLQAVKYAKMRGARVLAITNTVGSSITREADAVAFLNAGVEIGVAATKTFMAQLVLSYLIAGKKEKLREVPSIIDNGLKEDKTVRKIAGILKDKLDVFFIARGLNVPLAYEASLKLKEISYIHSEAYPGGELKHGTLSLIEPGVPVIIFAPNDETSAKMLGNLKEAKARGATIISFTDDEEIAAESDYVIRLATPKEKEIYPFALLVPLQLLAYYTSVGKGNDPDKPRNLAKAVTVE
jgi:glucosamine--fructose-6-phosphate aminotransferase (isomerizing)